MAWLRHNGFQEKQVSKFAVMIAFFGLAVAAEEFSLQIASAVASQTFQMKRAPLVLRSQGCSDPAKLEVSGKAEGLVNGTRRTMTLKLAPAPTPGVFGVFKEWPADGVWIVNLSAKCAAKPAGALVVLGESGPNREASKFYSRPATEAEIDGMLRSLGKK